MQIITGNQHVSKINTRYGNPVQCYSSYVWRVFKTRERNPLYQGIVTIGLNRIYPIQRPLLSILVREINSVPPPEFEKRSPSLTITTTVMEHSQVQKGLETNTLVQIPTPCLI